MPPLDPRLQQQGPPMPGQESAPPPPDQQPAPDQAVDQPTPDTQPPQDSELSAQPVHASPEEQAAADQFVGRSWQLIYDDRMFPQIVEMLRGPQGGDPAEGLATVTDLVVAKVAHTADQAGVAVPPDAMFHASGDVLEELAEVSKRAQIKDYSQDKNALERAWFQFLDKFRQRLDGVGEIDQAGAQNDLGKLMRADKNGTLEKVMRDLNEQDNSGVAGGEPGEGEPTEPPPPSGQGGPMQPPPRRGLGTAMGGA